LSAHESFDLDEFKYEIESKKIELLSYDVAEIEDLVRQKTNLIKNIMVPVKYANYNKYKEFVLEKIKYIILYKVVVLIQQHLMECYFQI